jgi:hypothetical protein
MAIGLLLSIGAIRSVAGESKEVPDRVEWERLRKVIIPRAEEIPWATLPWATDLMEARKKAAKEGKLLLVWVAGGGHPLGFV